MEEKIVENILEECAAEIRKCEKKILADCFEIGKQLLKARDALREWGGNDREGKWVTWVENDVKISIMQARRYIWVYERYGQGNFEVLLALNVSFTVLVPLASPSADPVAVAQIENELKQGKKLTSVEVLKRVPSTKPIHKSKSKEPKKLKPIPVAVDEPFLIDLVNEIRRRRKEASDVKGKNKSWSHHGIKITDLSCLLDWIERTVDDKIQELTRAVS